MESVIAINCPLRTTNDLCPVQIMKNRIELRENDEQLKQKFQLGISTCFRNNLRTTKQKP